ncbi:hypothetical protein, partial [Parafilimonas sp.]|uniref:hypothetical protein n=1 Tax=Parafilimonas sp. TaxID=1969739 RepID=UPI0039E258A4
MKTRAAACRFAAGTYRGAKAHWQFQNFIRTSLFFQWSHACPELASGEPRYVPASPAGRHSPPEAGSGQV